MQPGPAAVARRPGPLVVARPRQRVVAPLAGDGVRSRDQALMHDDAAAGAGADDHAEHRRRARRRAVGGLREREAVGVVRDAHRPAERGAEIGAEAPPVEPRRVRVLDQPGGRRDGAGHADADRAPARHVALEPRHQRRRPRPRCRRSGPAASPPARAPAARRRRRSPRPRSSSRPGRCRYAASCVIMCGGRALSAAAEPAIASRFS